MSAKHPYLQGVKHPRVLAHRGLLTTELRERGVADNTRAAFAAAIDAGATFIETDCHATRDGVVVLMHDEDLKRVAGDERRVDQVSHRELEEIMADRGGLLTLEDALAEFTNTRFNIDVKAEAAVTDAGRIVAAHAHRVLLTSFVDHRRKRVLQAARTAAGASHARPATSPGRFALIRVLAAVALNQPALARLALRGLDALQIPERQGIVPVLTPRLIKAAHSLGVEVHVWTINDPARMRELVEMGVDGIVTDRADIAIQTLTLESP